MRTDERAGWPRYRTQAGRDRVMAAYAAALAEWPVPFEEICVPTAYGPTHAIASGPSGAAPVVLLPSFSGTALAWRPNVEALSCDRRVYALDVIGQPGRSLARRRLRTRTDCAAWLAETLHGLGLGSASMVGCSYGGFLAANLALLAPERVDRLVLIGPVGVFAVMSPLVALRMRLRGLQRRLVQRLGAGRPVDAGRLHAPAVPRRPQDDTWRALMGAIMAEAPEVSLARPAVFSRAEFARLAAPVLLLIGEHEQLYEPRATLTRALALKPGLEAEIVEGADHLAAMAQPSLVNARITSFLAG